MYGDDTDSTATAVLEKPITPLGKVLPLPTRMPTPEEITKEYGNGKKYDASDLSRDLGSAGYCNWLIEQISEAPTVSRGASRIRSLRSLRYEFPDLREPVIDGLLRRGEIMNIIAAPKEGKSILSLDLAFSVIQGAKWMGRFPTAPGRVLIIDNELHRETITFRTAFVAEKSKSGIELDYVDDRIDYIPLRGELVDLHGLAKEIEYVKPGEYKLIILDAFYRFMPPKTDENDNGQIAELYNKMDSYANKTDAAICLIHHTSKGTQSGKKVTDVGAGAGAMTRATDTHLILRPHEDENVVVIEAAVRSFPPLEPFCARRKFPTWELDSKLDASKLKGLEERQGSAQAKEMKEAIKGRLLDAMTAPMTVDDMVAKATQLRLGIGYPVINTALRQDWLPNRKVRQAGLRGRKAMYINNKVQGNTDPAGQVEPPPEITQTPTEVSTNTQTTPEQFTDETSIESEEFTNEETVIEPPPETGDGIPF